MKILWVCNIIPIQIAKKINLPIQNSGGWINILIEALRKNPNYELTILFPISQKNNTYQGCIDRISYFSFFRNIKKSEKYDSNQKFFFKKILEQVNPQIIHIWGTEYPHTLAMVNACEKKDLSQHIVISIQGLISICAKHYYANLPAKIITGKTFRDFIRHDSIQDAQKKFETRGIYELNSLKKINHVIGRTEWDFACTKIINPRITYHQGNEILRDVFYEGSWTLENCYKYSIFMSQWEYPLKGLHIFLDAFKEIIKEYPNAQLITTGKNPLKPNFKEKLKQTYYDKYIIKLIKKWELEKHIIFLGKQLNESEMKEQYLHAHVYVLASSIENSSNSMGEAMLLGTPIVASNVGGISSMLTHGKEGFLYPFDEPYMLAHYIKRIFQDDKLAQSLSNAERIRAHQTHHIQKNIATYYNIYETIWHQ